MDAPPAPDPKQEGAFHARGYFQIYTWRLRSLFNLEPIDLGAHPNRDLLLFCSCLVKLWDARDQVEAAIRGTVPLTDDGRIMRRFAVGCVA